MKICEFIAPCLGKCVLNENPLECHRCRARCSRTSCNRWTVQSTNRRFLRLITERLSDVCLREINCAYAVFSSSDEDAECSSYVRINDGPTRRNISNAHKDPAHLLSAFLNALRSSWVEALTFSGLMYTPALAALVLEAPIIAHHLSFLAGSCAELTPTQFREVVLHFSPSSLSVYSCHLHACQITDDFLGALNKNRMQRTSFQNLVPVDGVSFCVTDDAIVDFCVQPDVLLGEEEDPPKESQIVELLLHNGSFTKDLFKRLVQAGSMSKRTQSLRIVVAPVRVEDEDLGDFVQHLSYRHHGWPGQRRIYDFPGKQPAAVGAMHLQIVLHPDNKLELIRAHRPNPLFHKSD